jgi:hypothetical protein
VDQLGIKPQLSREVNKQIGDLIKDMEVDQEERQRLQMVLDPALKQKREEYEAKL